MTTEKPQKFGMTFKEAVDYANCSLRHLQEEIKKKNLRAYKPGKEVMIPKEELDKWIKKKAVS